MRVSQQTAAGRSHTSRHNAAIDVNKCAFPRRKNEAVICNFDIWSCDKQWSTSGDGTVLCIIHDGNVNLCNLPCFSVMWMVWLLSLSQCGLQSLPNVLLFLPAQ